MAFNQLSTQSITCTGANVPLALNLTGNPTVAYVYWSTAVAGGPAPVPPGNPALYGDPNALESVWVAFGGSGVVAGPNTGILLVPSFPNLKATRIPLNSSMTYIAALGPVGTGVWISLGTES